MIKIIILYKQINKHVKLSCVYNNQQNGIILLPYITDALH